LTSFFVCEKNKFWKGFTKGLEGVVDAVSNPEIKSIYTDGSFKWVFVSLAAALLVAVIVCKLFVTRREKNNAHITLLAATPIRITLWIFSWFVSLMVNEESWLLKLFALAIESLSPWSIFFTLSAFIPMLVVGFLRTFVPNLQEQVRNGVDRALRRENDDSDDDKE